MIWENLPVLQVVLPLLAAPVCVLLRRPPLARLLALAVSWAALGISISLLARVLDEGSISYMLGGWAAPYGIEYRLDHLSAFVLVIVAAIGAVVLLSTWHSLVSEVPEDRHPLFYSLYVLCLTGMLGVVITGDAFNLFVFLEITSLSSYALIGLGKDRRALRAAFRYLVMGTVGATFILIGIGLIFMVTGTLNMADLADKLPFAPPENQRVVLVAFAFVAVGTGLKIGQFPLHSWLPDSYRFAPSSVAAFLSGTATKVSFYVLLRFLFSIFGIKLLFDDLGLRLDLLLLPLALVTIFAGALAAAFQTNVKRMLAYSTISQIGYMLLGVSLATSSEAAAAVSGLTGSIVHLFNHAVTKGGLFLVMGCLTYRLGSVDLDSLRGAGRRMPLTMFAFVLGGLSLIGTPLTVGFISKWYLVVGALQQGWWPVAATILVSSLLAVVYVWRVVETAYFAEPDSGPIERSDAPLSMLIPTWLLIGAAVLFGTWAPLTAGTAETAARM